MKVGVFQIPPHYITDSERNKHLLSCGMWGHLRASSSMYKRMTSRDSMNSDVEADSDLLQNGVEQELTNPSWKYSCPHVLMATIVAFLFGYHLGVVNEPLESISVDLGFSGDTLAEGLVVSTLLGAAFAGSLISGWIADGVGRRRAFQLCSLPMLMGASLCATATTQASMLTGRFLVGLGLGVGPPVASLYVAEVSPAHVRGTYGSLIQIATCLGLMAALVIGIPVENIVGWWRVCFWVSTIPAAILAIAMMFCAESPHWLYKLSGINAVFYFSSTVFRRAGVSSNLANVFVGIANLTGSVVALLLMDKLGRKVLLHWSFFGMVTYLTEDFEKRDFINSQALAMALQVFASSGVASNYGAFYFSVGGMLLFVWTFAVGAGPVPGLLLPEIFPSRIRAKAMAFCMSVHWVVNFFVGLMFLRLLDQLGPQLLYSIFGTFCVMAVVFVKRNVMETKGKSLQEIEIALLPQE
ncbi:probable plastidic glucose transporter 2 isoform X8 [Lycium barbarum]|uniref:probable plastidic glucose transporter 2 isoform X8 n=1 Tax=Lycium barbarum TaxID=112863 RepID=UPI00293F2CD3|nr:probable plastidic glucose transporter 2 isoform X8 [Lycium barbarum]